MANDTIMRLSTEFEALVEKQNELTDRMAGVIANIAISRQKDGKLNSLSNDLDKILDNLSSEIREVVYKKALIQVLKSNGTKNSSSSSSSNTNAIFKNRGF